MEDISAVVNHLGCDGKSCPLLLMCTHSYLVGPAFALLWGIDLNCRADCRRAAQN